MPITFRNKNYNNSSDAEHEHEEVGRSSFFACTRLSSHSERKDYEQGRELAEGANSHNMNIVYVSNR